MGLCMMQHILILMFFLQDVEGFEPAVMTTAKRLLSDGAIDNLIMEYTPGVLERAARYVAYGGKAVCTFVTTFVGHSVMRDNIAF